MDEWQRVVLHKVFNVEAEPTTTVQVDYNVQQGAFPAPVSDDGEESFF